MGNGVGDWISDKYNQSTGWAKDKYHQSKEWVKKNADEIDIATDFIPIVGQVKDAYL